MLEKCLSPIRKEPVLFIAALAALLSMIAVPPSAAYLGYVDVRVLCLLFCLMTKLLKPLTLLHLSAQPSAVLLRASLQKPL